MKFCWIPAGECQLGSPKAEQDYLVEKYLEGKRPDWLDAETESARGKYKSGGFWLGKYPVTQAEYEALIGSNPSKFKGDLLPVETASWDDAQAYMKKLNEGSAGSGLRRTMGEKSKFALPHEDAWEYACRGGLGNGRAFYWGDSLDGDKANCDGNGPYGTQTKGENLKRTTEVGSYVTKAPHPWGLCDTSGNVWQWCDNLYTKEGSSRVFRGGSWFNDAWGCRSANRNRFDPSHRSVNVGFRLAVPPSEGGEEAK